MGNPAIQRRIVALLLLIGQHFFIQQMREGKPAVPIIASSKRTIVAELGPVSLTWVIAPRSLLSAHRVLPLYAETRASER